MVIAKVLYYVVQETILPPTPPPPPIWRDFPEDPFHTPLEIIELHTPPISPSPPPKKKKKKKKKVSYSFCMDEELLIVLSPESS